MLAAVLDEEVNAFVGRDRYERSDEFGTLRRLLESRMGRRGKREFVAVLRLMETFRIEDVEAAVRDAIRLGH